MTIAFTIGIDMSTAADRRSANPKSIRGATTSGDRSLFPPPGTTAKSLIDHFRHAYTEYGKRTACTDQRAHQSPQREHTRSVEGGMMRILSHQRLLSWPEARLLLLTIGLIGATTLTPAADAQESTSATPTEMISSERVPFFHEWFTSPHAKADARAFTNWNEQGEI